MGFFSKLWNLVRGRGFKDEEDSEFDFDRPSKEQISDGPRVIVHSTRDIRDILRDRPVSSEQSKDDSEVSESKGKEAPMDVPDFEPLDLSSLPKLHPLPIEGGKESTAEGKANDFQRIHQSGDLRRMPQASPYPDSDKEKSGSEMPLPVPQDKGEEPILKTDPVGDIIKKISTFPRISEIEGDIGTPTLTEVTFRPTYNMNSINDVYSSLLSQAVISAKTKEGRVDTELVKILVENRQRIRHRFAGTVVITTKSGQVGKIEIDGILAEDLGDIRLFVEEGATYTSEELKVAMNNALSHFEQKFGAIGGAITTPAESKSTVLEIDTTISFA